MNNNGVMGKMIVII